MGKGIAKKRVVSSHRSPDLLGISLSENEIRLVHARNLQGRLNVQSVRHKKFSSGDITEMGEYLSQALSEMKLSSCRVVCILPSSLFISKNVDMPSTDREEIKKIIDLQAGRYTPYSRDEIVIDFSCVDTPGQHYTNVLLVIVNRLVIDRYGAVFDQAGLDLDRIGVASEGLALAYDAMAKSPGDGAIGGVYLDWENSDFTVMDNGQMLFVRNIPVGAKHFTGNPESARADFIKELNQSVAGYQNQGIGRAIKTILLTGLIEGLGFLEKEIKTGVPQVEASQVSVEILPFERYSDFSKEALQTVQSEKEVSWFDMIASLAGIDRLKIDLTPKEVRMRKQVREGGRDAMTLGILIMILLTLTVFFLAVKMFILRNRVEKLEALDRSITKEAKVLERTSTKARVLDNLLGKRGGGLYAFQKLMSLIGEEIYLTSFSYDNQGNLKFAGTADSMSRVFAFVTKLEESNYFRDVKTEQTKSRREGKREVADFEISCVLAEGV